MSKIIIGRTDAGKYYWRVYHGDNAEYTVGEQLFNSPDSVADALGFALRGGYPRSYCAALAESVLDALTSTEDMCVGG